MGCGRNPQGLTLHKATILHRGRSFDFTLREATLPNGRRVTLEAVRHPGASAIVALTAAREVILLHQYRHAVEDYIWEIPAGTRGVDEAPLACARRELVEEAGYGARRWDALGTLLPAPGYTDERLNLFLARDLVPEKQDLDEDELLEVHLKPLDQAIEMIFTGELQDAKAVAGLLLVWQRRAEFA